MIIKFIVWDNESITLYDITRMEYRIGTDSFYVESKGHSYEFKVKDISSLQFTPF